MREWSAMSKPTGNLAIGIGSEAAIFMVNSKK